MGEPGAVGPASSVGLLVNPIAGMGGAVGLKGTDGEAVLARAQALGATPVAAERARSALIGFLEAWPHGRLRPALLTVGGAMGQVVAEAAGYRASIACEAGATTTSEDTRHAATVLRDEGVDLLLFAGGDGTARDVSAAVGDELVVLGIPAGVKVQSAVFARSPRSAGTIAAEYLSSVARPTHAGEVVDLDEEAYRAGRLEPRLFGSLRVPHGRLVQSRKAPTPAAEQAVTTGIAAAVIDDLRDGCYIIGPGTTTRAILEGLGLPKTLVGVDVIEVEAGQARLVAPDVCEADLLRIVAEGPATVVLTPIGGQGFILGRGNQQISPAVMRALGRIAITIVATPGKIAALAGRPLLVDTGDTELDRQLAGYRRVITGRRESVVVRVDAA